METAVLESLLNAACSMTRSAKRDFSRGSGSELDLAPRSVMPVDVLRRRIQVGAGWPLHVIPPRSIPPRTLAAESAFLAWMMPLVKHEVQP